MADMTARLARPGFALLFTLSMAQFVTAGFALAGLLATRVVPAGPPLPQPPQRSGDLVVAFAADGQPGDLALGWRGVSFAGHSLPRLAATGAAVAGIYRPNRRWATPLGVAQRFVSGISDLDGDRPQPPMRRRVRLPHPEGAFAEGAAAYQIW
jgi:hypothetical protein